MEIKDKIAVVTGASEGIGKAIAEQLTAHGAKVVLAARNDEKIAALAHELKDALAVHTDMANPADIQNLIDRTLEVYGRIDILVNNAGVGMYGPMEAVNMDEYRHMMNVNVLGPVHAMEFAIPHMRAQGGGMIVNISSRVSKNYYPNLAAYASTKYALNAISLTAREALAKDPIVVSVMHPKMTATGVGRNAMGTPMDSVERARANGMPIDTAEQVAERTIALIESEEPEAEM